jgi:hypothetical protein
VAEPADSWEYHAGEAVDQLSRWLAAPDSLDPFAKTLFVQAPAAQAALKTAPPATTLAAAAVRQTELGSCVVHWFAYGDAAVMRLVGRKWEWQSPRPDLNRRGTDALPGHAGRLSTGEAHLDTGELIVLATDGFAEAVVAHEAELARVVTAAVARRVSAAVFGSLLDFDIDGLYDDKTLVVLGG